MANQPKKKFTPVVYAEDILLVHKVYDSAVKAHDRLVEALEDQALANAILRSLREAETDRTIDLSVDESIANPDFSVAAMERHMKVAAQKDDELMIIRDKIGNALRDLGQAEARVLGLRSESKMYNARLVELGGLLNFYAAVKLQVLPTGYNTDTTQGETSE